MGSEGALASSRGGRQATAGCLSVSWTYRATALRMMADLGMPSFLASRLALSSRSSGTLTL